MTGGGPMSDEAHARTARSARAGGVEAGGAGAGHNEADHTPAGMADLGSTVNGGTVSADEPPSGGPRQEAEQGENEVAAPRPLIERLGMAAVALVLALLFGALAAAAFAGGEPFLAIMAGTGTMMTLWVGALTLRRG